MSGSPMASDVIDRASTKTTRRSRRLGNGGAVRHPPVRARVSPAGLAEAGASQRAGRVPWSAPRCSPAFCWLSPGVNTHLEGRRPTAPAITDPDTGTARQSHSGYRKHQTGAREPRPPSLRHRAWLRAPSDATLPPIPPVAPRTAAEIAQRFKAGGQGLAPRHHWLPEKDPVFWACGRFDPQTKNN